MRQEAQLREIKSYVINFFNNDNSGHDCNHMNRVANYARIIAEAEGSDPFISEVCGWVHDLIDLKLVEDPELAKQDLKKLLEQLRFSAIQINQIISAIDTVSFRKGKTPETEFAQIVQDADRLDAIGAIGVARAISYGTSKHQPLYDSEHSSTLAHFTEKLFKLEARLHTQAAKKMAKDRHQFMMHFYHQFMVEWREGMGN
ncbi:uncharacterized protein SAMN04488134_101101 [Amphibacillus marinus]|uniref:HD/PDEase domain-containing protein n=1 Tax=Amphibacillus marinus TaxID=872970 RepID=A0A1H8GLQ4_9BACI|nr:HD domain-containing protein [Amphibacillus marinus]SEN44674.1 uncharacterized protein SAMN04488134_101101 [Amphibacillus marinus]